MAKVTMLRQAVYPFPGNRFCFSRIPCLRISGINSCISMQLGYFLCSVHLFPVFIKKLGALLIRMNCLMTVHAYIGRRNGGLLSFKRRTMAIQTIYLVNAGMYLMGIKDRLFRLITFLPSEANHTFCHIITTDHKHYNSKHGYVCFVFIERDRFGADNTFRIIA